MENPSLQIGGGDWAVKETKLLGTNPVLNRKIPVEIDVTNATIGTRVNKEGFIANGPKNLLTFSEDFSNVSWVKVNGSSVSLNTNYINPSGTLSTYKYTASNLSFGGILRRQSIPVTLGTTYNYSIFCKKDNHRYVGIRINTSTNGNRFPNYDFDTDTINNQGVTGVILLREIFANGWIKLNLTYTATTTSASGPFDISLTAANGETGTVLNGDESVYLWRAQVELGSVATEYYPTTTRTNLARIDYSSGESALLIEPQRTNVNLYSEDFGDSSYIKSSSTVIINDIISPANDFTADRITNTNGTQAYFRKTFTLIAGSTYAVSVFFKKGNQDYCYLRNTSTSNESATYFDLTTGQVKNIGSGAISAKIEAFSNGWFRCTLISVPTTASTLIDFGVATSAQDNRIAAIGDFIYLWGAQVELGSYATSYIPTLASAVTRNADLISKAGISDLINSQEGVLFVESEYVRAGPGGGARKLISVNDGTSTNLIDIFIPSGQNTLFVRVRASSQNFGAITTSNVPLGKIKVAYSYKANNYSLYINGTLIQKITTGENFIFSSALNILQVGDGEAIGDELGGRIDQLRIYKTILTDAQLITLTTI
jgi:hypothetical protein